MGSQPPNRSTGTIYNKPNKNHLLIDQGVKVIDWSCHWASVSSSGDVNLFTEGVKIFSLPTKAGQSSSSVQASSPDEGWLRGPVLFPSAVSTKHCKIVDAQRNKSIKSAAEKTPVGCSEWHANSTEASVKIRLRIEHKGVSHKEQGSKIAIEKSRLYLSECYVQRTRFKDVPCNVVLVSWVFLHVVQSSMNDTEQERKLFLHISATLLWWNQIKMMPCGRLKRLVSVAPLEIIYQRCVTMTLGFSNRGKERVERAIWP